MSRRGRRTTGESSGWTSEEMDLWEEERRSGGDTRGDEERRGR